MGQVDLRRVLSAVGAAAEATTEEEFADAVLASAVAVVGADSAVVTEVGGPVLRVWSWPKEFLPTERQVAFERLNRDEPWPLATHTRAGFERPVRISDFFDRRQYQRLAIYGELLRLLEVDHQVAFSLPMGRTRLLCVAVDRQGRDFTEADLDRLDALRRPLLANAIRIGQLHARVVIEDGSGPVALTRRESDVLSLVTGGLANDQIGRRLGISARTVNKHLEHIYAKIGVRNRTEATARWLSAPGSMGG
jgi:DNA-binding CsgD family transcriptional regulator